MSKYAPNAKCSVCQAVDGLCLNCAMDWKLAQHDKELRLLRKLEREVRHHFPAFLETLEKLDLVRTRKPKLKTTPKENEGPK